MAMVSTTSSQTTVGSTNYSSNPLIWDRPQRENFKNVFNNEMTNLGLDPNNGTDRSLLLATVDPRRNAFVNKLLVKAGKDPIAFNASFEGLSPDFGQAMLDRGAAKRVKDAAVRAFTSNTGVFGQDGQFADQFGLKTGGKLKSASITMNEESTAFFRNAEMRSRFAYGLSLERMVESLRNRTQSA